MRVAYSGLTAGHTVGRKKAQGYLGTAVALGAQSLPEGNSKYDETKQLCYPGSLLTMITFLCVGLSWNRK